MRRSAFDFVQELVEIVAEVLLDALLFDGIQEFRGPAIDVDHSGLDEELDRVL